MIQQIAIDYLITFGWAITGCISMGLGIIIALKMFDWSTRDVDEWELVKQGNIPIAIILASVVLSLGIVISAAIQPKSNGDGQIRVVTSPDDSGIGLTPGEEPFGN